MLLAIGALLGTAGSVAFGSASQLVARFPAKCGQALALGIVAPGPTVLLLQALLRIGAHPTETQQRAFFLLAALAPLNALLAISALLWKHWHDLQHDKAGHGGHLHGRTASWGQDSITESMLESGEWGSPGDHAEMEYGGGDADVPLLPADAHDEVSLLDLLPASFATMTPMMQQGADAVLLLPHETTVGAARNLLPRAVQLPSPAAAPLPVNAVGEPSARAPRVPTRMRPGKRGGQ